MTTTERLRQNSTTRRISRSMFLTRTHPLRQLHEKKITLLSLLRLCPVRQTHGRTKPLSPETIRLRFHAAVQPSLSLWILRNSELMSPPSLPIWNLTLTPRVCRTAVRTDYGATAIRMWLCQCPTTLTGRTADIILMKTAISTSALRQVQPRHSAIRCLSRMPAFTVPNSSAFSRPRMLKRRTQRS